MGRSLERGVPVEGPLSPAVCRIGQQIIDSAFKMTEELVAASTRLAEKIVKASQDALGEADKEGRRLSVKG